MRTAAVCGAAAVVVPAAALDSPAGTAAPAPPAVASTAAVTAATAGRARRMTSPGNVNAPAAHGVRGAPGAHPGVCTRSRPPPHPLRSAGFAGRPGAYGGATGGSETTT